MTRKEINAEILRLRNDGMKLDDIASKLGETPSNVRNVVYRARGEKAAEIEISKYNALIVANGAIDRLRETIRQGDRVSFMYDGVTIKARVIKPHPYVVHCQDDRGLNYSPMYMDITRGWK